MDQTYRMGTHKSIFEIFFLLTSVVTIGMAGCQKQTIPTQSKVDPLDQTLQAGMWGPESSGFGWILSFRDSRFREDFAGEGCGGYGGTYTIAAGKVILTPESNPNCPGPMAGAVHTCTLHSSDQSLFSTQYLDCGPENIYWNSNERVRTGEPRFVGEYTMVSMELVEGTTNSDVKYREAPNIEAKSYSCSYSADSFPDKPPAKTPFIPINRNVKVIGRTPEMVKVQKWDNYWYYVQPEPDWYAGGCSPSEGWVFGEFVTIKR